jgi:hypothetical protein
VGIRSRGLLKGTCVNKLPLKVLTYKVSLSLISPLLRSAVSPTTLKAIKHQNVNSEVKKWSIVKTPGRTIAEAKI